MKTERVRLLLGVVSELTGIAPGEILQGSAQVPAIVDARRLAVWLSCEVVRRSVSQTAMDFDLDQMAVSYIKRRASERYKNSSAWRERADRAQGVLVERRAVFQEAMRSKVVSIGADGSTRFV
jgi:hypothetical protein